MRLIDADALKTTASIQRANFNTIETIRRWIDQAPTIDAVPARHGKWLHPEEGDEDYHSVACSCSVCGWKFNLYEDDIDGAPFCAMCGAKMEPVAPWYQVEEVKHETD